VELYPIPLKLVKHFATLMTAEVSPLNRKCINLTDVSKDFVKFCIQWMYAGGTFCTSPKAVKLAETNVGQVLQLYFFCDKSGIAPLKHHATDLLERNIAVKPFLLEDFDAVYKGTSIFDGLRLVVAAGSKKWAKLEMVKKWYTPQIFQAECTNTYRAGVEALSALWNEIESEQLQKAWEVAERGERKNAQGWAQMRAGKGAEHNGGPSKSKPSCQCRH